LLKIHARYQKTVMCIPAYSSKTARNCKKPNHFQNYFPDAPYISMCGISPSGWDFRQKHVHPLMQNVAAISSNPPG
ncbi:MAG: hypothetical protein JSV44_07165, partial [Candidatus Zixiibacteriota bacterium]